MFQSVVAAASIAVALLADFTTLSVLCHHLECEMKSPHLVDFS